MKQMKATVYLDTSLRREIGQNRIVIDIRKGTTVKEIIKAFNLIEGEVGLVIINSKIGNLCSIVEENDSLELYPVIAGG
ncbi:MAG: hypothetical protein PHS15_06945 [Clostridiaceae bacterium]|nr:hypothetical protein [Clostridiaceae bacterium]